MSIAFYSTGGLVLTLKILVIVQLVAFAVILAAAIAASPAAAAQAAITVNRTIVGLVAATTAAISRLGAPSPSWSASTWARRSTG